MLIADDLIADEFKHILDPVKHFKNVMDFYLLCENSLITQYDKLMELLREKKGIIEEDDLEFDNYKVEQQINENIRRQKGFK